MKSGFDFSGWATKNNLKCADGRTIRRDAFKEDDGKTVPLVWQHRHDSPENVLGHALLENRNDGVYAYCSFNDSFMGKEAKELVKHGDIDSLSIYANKLKESNGDVFHGCIREVSLVLAGANRGAKIDYLNMAHSEDSMSDAIIYCDGELYHSDEESDDDQRDNYSEVYLVDGKYYDEDGNEVNSEDIQHMDGSFGSVYMDEQGNYYDEDGNAISHYDIVDPNGDPFIEHAEEKQTIKEVIDSMTKVQQQVLYFLIGEALKADPKEIKEENQNG